MTLQELFSDPSKWTKGAFARDAEGKDVGHSGKEAVCFCLFGGINRCYPNQDLLGEVFHKIQLELKTSHLTRWNDLPERKFEDIKDLVTRLNI